MHEIYFVNLHVRVISTLLLLELTQSVGLKGKPKLNYLSSAEQKKKL